MDLLAGAQGIARRTHLSSSGRGSDLCWIKVGHHCEIPMEDAT